jgi:hypothetical protein
LLLSSTNFDQSENLDEIEKAKEGNAKMNEMEFVVDSIKDFYNVTSPMHNIYISPDNWLLRIIFNEVFFEWKGNLLIGVRIWWILLIFTMYFLGALIRFIRWR